MRRRWRWRRRWCSEGGNDLAVSRPRPHDPRRYRPMTLVSLHLASDIITLMPILLFFIFIFIFILIFILTSGPLSFPAVTGSSPFFPRPVPCRRILDTVSVPILEQSMPLPGPRPYSNDV